MRAQNTRFTVKQRFPAYFYVLILSKALTLLTRRPLPSRFSPSPSSKGAPILRSVRSGLSESTRMGLTSTVQEVRRALWAPTACLLIQLTIVHLSIKCQTGGYKDLLKLLESHVQKACSPVWRERTRKSNSSVLASYSREDAKQQTEGGEGGVGKSQVHRSGCQEPPLGRNVSYLFTES